jgi:hypothetical protein
MPLTSFARLESKAGSGAGSIPQDEAQQVISGLRIPTPVAAVSYPRGCRIRRVRVKAQKQQAAAGQARQPLIVSRRALRGSPDDATS